MCGWSDGLTSVSLIRSIAHSIRGSGFCSRWSNWICFDLRKRIDRFLLPGYLDGCSYCDHFASMIHDDSWDWSSNQFGNCSSGFDLLDLEYSIHGITTNWWYSWLQLPSLTPQLLSRALDQYYSSILKEGTSNWITIAVIFGTSTITSITCRISFVDDQIGIFCKWILTIPSGFVIKIN